MPDITPAPNNAFETPTSDEASAALVSYCNNVRAGLTPFGNVFDRTPQLQEVLDLEAAAAQYILLYYTYYSDYLAILNGYIL